MPYPIYLSKNLPAGSSTVYGSLSSASSTSTPTVTINTSITQTTARRLFVGSSTTSAGLVLNVTGTIEGGGTRTETMTYISSLNGFQSIYDYLSIASVTVSSANNVPLQFGTNSVGGTPWKSIDVVSLGGPLAGQISFSSSSNSMTGSIEFTFDDPFGYYPIVRPGVANPAPIVWVSSTLSAVTGLSEGLVNAEGQQWIPAYAYRLTITSTSSGAGTVYATVLQAGAGAG